MKSYLFPGQGSQFVGMGKGLFGLFKDYTDQADEILGYSIEELCQTDANNQLNNTAYTQPALYVVNALMYFKHMEEGNGPADMLAGHSLGEYNALLAAGVFDFATGLKMVKKRGELMSKATGGAMAAVIGLRAERIEELLGENGLSKVYVANYNTPMQTVISGEANEVAAAKEVFENNGCQMYVKLPVSGAFHSPYMKPARDEFEGFVQQYEFVDSAVPVISNVEGKPYHLNGAKELLVNQIVSSVKWVEIIEYMESSGVTEFIEIGPKRVLTGLVQRIKREK